MVPNQKAVHTARQQAVAAVTALAVQAAADRELLNDIANSLRLFGAAHSFESELLRRLEAATDVTLPGGPW